MFPEARILITVRDPRDIALSYDDRWGAGRRDSSFLMQSCAQIRYYFDHLLDSSPFPDHICRVRYELLVTDPEGEMKRICGFLNVTFESAMLDFYRSHQSVERDMPGGKHHQLLSRPVTAERIGRYKHAFSARQVKLMEEFFGSHLHAHGYPAAASDGDPFTAEEKRWLKRGTACYLSMRSGQVRRKLQAKTRIRILLLKWRAILMRERYSRLAVISPDWAARVVNH